MTPSRPAGFAPHEASLATWLRAVLWASFVIPTIAFAVAVVWGYDRATTQAEATVDHASALALRHAQRTFEIARGIAQRADLVSGGSTDAVREREAEVHQRLSDLSAGLPSVVNLNVWNEDGLALARSDLYPVNRESSVADRAYFIEQRDANVPLGISEVLTGRQSGRELVNATIRRQASGATFSGVAVVSLSPEFFRDYYSSLASEQPNLASFALIRIDGTIIARWPRLTDGRTHVDLDNPTRAKVLSGVDQGTHVLPRRDSRESRLVSFRRVPGLPLYVVAGVSQAATYSSWFRFVALLSAIWIPTTAGLVYVSLVALRKTRREQVMAEEMRDEIRRRSHAEQAMLETQKLEALSQLTGGVAHDFNNLLTIVSNNLHMYRRAHPDALQSRHLEAIGRAVTSGVRLTRQLLSFSRKQALSPETVVLQQWLPATESLIRSTLGSRVVLDFSVAPDTSPVTVDLAELELALINTALNAQHAMTDGGTLRVTAGNAVHARSGARPMVAIRVHDDGVGIRPALLSKVFEPFFTTKGPGKGSGLGLSQVAGLCEQAGGFAIAESEPGRGTVIGMYFPATPTAHEPHRDANVAASGPLSGHVLLVEDNEDVATATESVLRGAGLEVSRASNASAALSRLASPEPLPDLVLTDISMPGSTDGIGLAFVVRQRWPALPVLLVTGYADRIADAMAAGLRVMTKPVPPEDVLREIGRMMSARPAEASAV